jgi:hypothetical protein
MRRRRHGFGRGSDPKIRPRTPAANARLPVDLGELHPSVGVLGRPPDSMSAVMAGVLRKEVIQPQVPLRLPCYDFTPVADLTVDGCAPCGFAHRLKVKPTPMV